MTSARQTLIERYNAVNLFDTKGEVGDEVIHELLHLASLARRGREVRA